MMTDRGVDWYAVRPTTAPPGTRVRFTVEGVVMHGGETVESPDGWFFPLPGTYEVLPDPEPPEPPNAGDVVLGKRHGGHSVWVQLHSGAWFSASENRWVTYADLTDVRPLVVAGVDLGAEARAALARVEALFDQWDARYGRVHPLTAEGRAAIAGDAEATP